MATESQSYRAVPAFVPALIRKSEACRLRAYLDQGHVLTIGYGHTGPEVRPDLEIDQARADVFLAEDLQVAVRRLYGVLREEEILALTNNEWGALIDFVFNTGAGRNWDIWRDINAGKLSLVPAELARFERYKDPRTGQEVISRGLQNRRNVEIAIWNTPDPANQAELQRVPPPATAAIEAVQAEEPVDAPSSAFVRTVETPPAPKNTRGMIGTLVTSVGGSVAYGAGQAVQYGPDAIHKVINGIGDWNLHISAVDHAVAIMSGVGAALTVAGIVWGYFAHKSSKT